MRKMRKLRRKKIKEIMDQMNAKSDAMGSRIKDLVDEWIDAGDSEEGL